jgi:hypothetical protein
VRYHTNKSQAGFKGASLTVSRITREPDLGLDWGCNDIGKQFQRQKPAARTRKTKAQTSNHDAAANSKKQKQQQKLGPAVHSDTSKPPAGCSVDSSRAAPTLREMLRPCVSRRPLALPRHRLIALLRVRLTRTATGLRAARWAQVARYSR